MSQFKLTRDVSTKECYWLDRDYKEGEIVYLYRGATYGCITDDGDAFTEKENETPFFELPLDSVKEIK